MIRRLRESTFNKFSNANAPIGTPNLQYAPAKFGPYRCDHCVHYQPFKPPVNVGGCSHPGAAKDAQQKKIPVIQGKPAVEAGGCCKFFRRK